MQVFYILSHTQDRKILDSSRCLGSQGRIKPSVAQFPLPPGVKQETGVNRTPEIITPGDQKKSVAQGKKITGLSETGG